MVVSIITCCCITKGPCGGRGGFGGLGGLGGSLGVAQLAPMINIAPTAADALHIFFIHCIFNVVSFAGPAQTASPISCRISSSPAPAEYGYPENRGTRYNCRRQYRLPANTIIRSCCFSLTGYYFTSGIAKTLPKSPEMKKALPVNQQCFQKKSNS